MRKLKIKNNKGMSYVELIVVLSIFAVLSSVVIFNYGDFQARVDIKNLASDIALKIVEAQKSSINGVLPTTGAPFPDWKPAYGVYFDITTLLKQKQFIYFADLDNSNTYISGSGETLDTINITKNNYISNIDKCSTNPCVSGSNSINSLFVIFKRPDSSAIFSDATITGSQYVQITINSPKNAKAYIKIYPSGRVQVN